MTMTTSCTLAIGAACRHLSIFFAVAVLSFTPINMGNSVLNVYYLPTYIHPPFHPFYRLFV